MALSYTQVYGLTDNGAVHQRMLIAVAIAAQAVFVESPATQDHALRLSWAQKAIANVPDMARKMTIGVLTDPVIQVSLPSISDTEVQTAVDTLVNQFLLA
jgi:predicted Zn-dependent protease